jgi:hypothetical protein
MAGHHQRVQHDDQGHSRTSRRLDIQFLFSRKRAPRVHRMQKSLVDCGLVLPCVVRTWVATMRTKKAL